MVPADHQQWTLITEEQDPYDKHEALDTFLKRTTPCMKIERQFKCSISNEPATQPLT